MWTVRGPRRARHTAAGRPAAVAMSGHQLPRPVRLCGGRGAGDVRGDALAEECPLDSDALGKCSDDLQAVLAHAFGSWGLAAGTTGLLSQRSTRTTAPVSRRRKRAGPGAYLRAFATSSLTISWTISTVAVTTGMPWSSRAVVRKADARWRAWAMREPSLSSASDASSSEAAPPSAPLVSSIRARFPLPARYPF